MMFKMIDNNEIYNRVISGKPFNKKLKKYSDSTLEIVLESLIQEEEYEKCAILKELVDNRTHKNGFNL